MSSTPSPTYVILAALAFDETGDHALRTAADLANRHPGSQLHLVHVLESADSSDSTTLFKSNAFHERLEQHASAELKAQLDRAIGTLPNKVLAHLRAGVPWRAIVQIAADLDADLVVLGSHQRKGVEKLVHGSVAQQVLQHAHCPVVISMAKDHSSIANSEQIEPPCPQCVETRARTSGKQFWCERHARVHGAPHIYEPRSRSGGAATSHTYSTY